MFLIATDGAWLPKRSLQESAADPTRLRRREMMIDEDDENAVTMYGVGKRRRAASEEEEDDVENPMLMYG